MKTGVDQTDEPIGQRLSRGLGVVLAGLVLFSLTAPTHAGQIDFARDIRPLLSDRCFFCHGPDASERKAGLRLDVESEAKKGEPGAAAIVSGQPDQSALVERIRTADPDDQMPPPDSGKSLSAEERELLEQWISEGAVWADHWAYEVPRRQTPPAVEEVTWPRHWIDHWVLSNLEEHGVKPSPDAAAATLARRLSVDLCGVVPDPGVVAAFASDGSEQAYRKLVDAFLESPQFGERMAAYWLDLVRFADTVGYHGDQDHNVSPYRDYVIDAFNENLPFDQFTREQLAGDLLPNPSMEQIVATGYNRLLQTSHEGGVQPKEYLAIYAADRVRNLSGVWLGATMGCAQCHDHKYDPYTSKDFYSMQAFFADVDEVAHFKNGTNSLPTRRDPEIEVLSKRERLVLALIDDEIAANKIGVDADQPDLARLERLKATIKAGRRKVMITRSVEPRVVRFLPRGNWLDESGAIMKPEVPEFLGGLEVPEQQRANRLQLAEWLVDAEGGVGLLTARVMVNRFWYLMFGAGLSRSLDDFGGQGEAPYHRELLDQLAVEFVDSGWDVKHVFRLIATSRVYRQSSTASEELRERDPLNIWLGRQGRYRLPAEAIRDSLLSISGLLDREIGGASVKPYQPEGYYRHLNFPPRKYAADPGGKQWRRGVYVHWQRQFLHPMMAAFDAPSREECSAQRPVSNTPVAALVLLNDPSFVKAAEAFAQMILMEGGTSDRSRLEFAFKRALSRMPDEEEIGLLAELLSADGNGKGDSLQSWILVARAVLNLSETITRQ